MLAEDRTAAWSLDLLLRCPIQRLDQPALDLVSDIVGRHHVAGLGRRRGCRRAVAAVMPRPHQQRLSAAAAAQYSRKTSNTSPSRSITATAFTSSSSFAAAMLLCRPRSHRLILLSSTGRPWSGPPSGASNSRLTTPKGNPVAAHVESRMQLRVRRSRPPCCGRSSRAPKQADRMLAVIRFTDTN